MLETVSLNSCGFEAAPWRLEKADREHAPEAAFPVPDSDVFTSNPEFSLSTANTHINDIETSLTALFRPPETNSASARSSQPDSPPKAPAADQNTAESAAGDNQRCRAAPKAADKPKTPPGELENRASQYEIAQQDLLRAKEIYARMNAERQLHLTKMRAMLANLETEICRIWEEVALRRQKIHDDLMAKWEKLLFA